MNIRQIFLVSVAIGLLPVALSYGLVPQKSLSYLYGISVQGTNNIHVFRAVMGLYLAFAIFWIAGAFIVQIRQAALYSLVVFMLGLAAGRALSINIDGMPHWLLIAYLVLELCFCIFGIILLNKSD